MASSSLSDILVRIGADITDLKSGVNQATAALQGIAAPISGLMSAFKGLGEAIMLAFAVDAIADFVMHIVDLGENLGDLSQQVGMTTQEIAALGYAGKSVDMSVENMVKSMVKLEVSMVKARNGSVEQAAAFAALGISVTDANGNLKETTQIKDEIADAFKDMKDGADKAALAVALFGRGGAQLIPYLNEGKAGMDAMAEASKRAGTQMSDLNAKEFAETKALANELGESFVGVSTTIVEMFLPAINNLTTILTNLTQGINNAMKENGSFRFSIEVLVAAINLLVAVVGTAVQSIAITWNQMAKGIEASIAMMIGALNALGKAFQLDFAGASAAWEEGFKNAADIAARYQAKINASVNSIIKSWADIGLGGPKTDEEKPKGPKSDKDLAIEGAAIAAQHAKQSEALNILNAAIKGMETGLAAAEREAKRLAETPGIAPEKIAASNKLIELMKSGLQQARKDADKIEFQPIVDGSRRASEEVAADWTGSRSGLLRKQIEVLNTYLAQVKGHGEQELEIQRDINHKKAELHRSEAADAKKGSDQQMSDYKAMIQQKLAAAKGDLAAQKQIIDEAVKYLETSLKTENNVYRQLKLEQVKIDKEIAEQKKNIDKDTMETDLKVKKLALEKERLVNDERLAIGDMTNRQHVEHEIQALEQIYAAEVNMLAKERELYAKGSLEYEKVQNKMTLLAHQHDNNRQQIVHQGIMKQISEYQRLSNSIGNMFSSTISDMLTTQQTWQQGMMKVLNKIADEFANFIGMMISKWILHELAKTASSGTQSSIRAAISAAEGDSLIGMIFKVIGEWLFGETAKTAATVAAATPVITAVMAEKAAFASEGATAAGASVAAIPFVGWTMVPEVYAATHALLSAPLAVGAWNVPNDLIAPLHKGEMVVPENFASGLRSSAQGASDNKMGGGSSGTVNININAIDSRSGMQFVKSQAGAIAATLKAQMRNGTKFA